nr:PREDICTED: uncharacterized protein LOC106706359 [Latimeria chalumnae]|eukprot:XP_014352698.1 PREDICTED: uncharacterized protein LOC106706359 [Latimeria chalumnae]
MVTHAQVKAAILSRPGITPEQCREKFRQRFLWPGESVRLLYYKLKDYCWRWLRPDTRSAPEVALQVLMEQFTNALPTDIQEWVRWHPTNTDLEAVILAERYLAAKENEPCGQPIPKPWRFTNSERWQPGREADERATRAQKDFGGADRGNWRTMDFWGSDKSSYDHYNGGQPYEKPNEDVEPMQIGAIYQGEVPESQGSFVAVADGARMPRNRFSVTVYFGEKLLEAYVDSRSCQTLMQESLVPPTQWVDGERLTLACIHGDLRTYPIAKVLITMQGVPSPIQVGLVRQLPCDLLIGRDFPNFLDLYEICLTSPEPKGALEAVFPFEDAELYSGNGKPRKTKREKRQAHQAYCKILQKVQGAWIAPTVRVKPGENTGTTTNPARDSEPFRTLDLRQYQGRFRQEQLEDPTLRNAFSQLEKINGVPQGEGPPDLFPHFIMSNDLATPPSDLAADKTRDRSLERFVWPGLYKEVKDFCGSCPDCQKVAPRLPPRAPLVPLPIIETPFQCIGMDLVGPLDKSAQGHKYVLVFVDYATRYPEAVPLRVASATNVATALFSLISRVGILKEILTDQGTPFMSKVMQHLCTLLRIKTLRTSIYHPQTDGLVERFNQTLKQMLKRVVRQDGRDWDLLLPYLLFAFREVPQASTGFSPFELLHARQPWELLDVVRETWESPTPPTLTLVEYVAGMKERMEKVSRIVKEHLQAAQTQQKAGYNTGAQLREFKKGDKVLVMIPTTEHKFLARWQGPYEIAEKINSVNYRVYQPGKRKPFQTYHLNLLKPWKDREVLWITTKDKEADLGPVTPMRAESKILPNFRSLNPNPTGTGPTAA